MKKIHLYNHFLEASILKIIFSNLLSTTEGTSGFRRLLIAHVELIIIGGCGSLCGCTVWKVCVAGVGVCGHPACCSWPHCCWSTPVDYGASLSHSGCNMFHMFFVTLYAMYCYLELWGILDGRLLRGPCNAPPFPCHSAPPLWPVPRKPWSHKSVC